MSNLDECLRRLDGSIVTLKSHRGDGWYVDAHHSYDVMITGCERNRVVDSDWTKFYLHHLGDSIVCFQSVRFPNFYIDMNPEEDDDEHVVKLTHHNEVPESEPWARFSIHGDELLNVAIRSERWTNRWWDANPDGLRGIERDEHTPPDEEWGRFQIGFPAPITESWEEIFSQENKTSEKMTCEYSFTVGFSRTDTESHTDSATISIEIQKNFGVPEFTSGSVTMGASYSHEWTREESSTFSTEHSHTTTYTVDPGKTATIKQLRGLYGPLSIRAAKTAISVI